MWVLLILQVLLVAGVALLLVFAAGTIMKIEKIERDLQRDDEDMLG